MTPMHSSFLLSFSLIFLGCGFALQAQATGGPPLPTDFDPKAPMPKNLPSLLNMPPNTRIEVTCTRRIPRAQPPASNNPFLVWDPDLQSAEIEKGARDTHAVFHWEGAQKSEAFIIRGMGFRQGSLVYPNTVRLTGPTLDFRVNAMDDSEGTSGDFPGLAWYKPSDFVGTATLNGGRVLVFAPGEQKSDSTTYPSGDSICLDPKSLLPVWLGDSMSIYTFTYAAAPDVQISPQGMFLSVIQRKLGHYP